MASNALRRENTSAAVTTSGDAGGIAAEVKVPLNMRMAIDQYWSACTTKDGTRWECDVMQRILELNSLPENWDGYSAIPINSSVMMFAISVINNAMRLTTPVPQIVPMVDGGLQLEWHERGWDLELAINQPYQSEFYFRDRGTGAEEVVDLTSDYSALHRKLDELGKR